MFDKGSKPGFGAAKPGFGAGAQKTSFKPPKGADVKADLADAKRIQGRFDALEEQDLSAEEHSKETYEIASEELNGFRERAQKEAKRMMNAVDSEYWFAVVFQNREQKEQFLKAAGLLDLGDKYLPGQDVATRMGLQVDAVEVNYNTSDKLDAKLARLARPLQRG